MENARASRMSRALKAVSDVNRIRILEVLVQGEFCVSELVERLGIDQPKVSHHLAILRSAGVIRSRRDGRHINYSVRPGVHRKDRVGTAMADVFQLGDLAVAFNFGQPALQRTVAPAPVEERHDGQADESAAAAGA